MKVHLIAAGKFHDIDFARLELLKLLAEHADFRTSVASDYAATASLAHADLLITYPPVTSFPTQRKPRLCAPTWSAVADGSRSMAPIRSCDLGRTA